MSVGDVGAVFDEREIKLQTKLQTVLWTKTPSRYLNMWAIQG